MTFLWEACIIVLQVDRKSKRELKEVMIEKIERISLVDEAYKRIKQSILSESFYEGNKIPSENALSKTLNVSRVVIREALTRLRSENIIVTYQGKGSFKANPENFANGGKPLKGLTFEDFKKIAEFRYAIEKTAVRAAVREASDQELNELTVLADQMARCGEDVDAFNRADYDFHQHIIKCSHNDLLIKAFGACSGQVIAALSEMNGLSDSRDFALKIHREMAKALVRRKGKAVLEIMKTNSEYNLARMSELL